MIEEFRGELLMTGEDISVDYKLGLIRQNLDKIKKMGYTGCSLKNEYPDKFVFVAFDR